MSAQPPDDRWLNEQLRNVPLPVGLKAQLRAVAVGSDAQFDGRLRDVPVPRELAATLRQIVDDEALDERLRGVALPAGLAAGLRGVPDDESLDCQLRETAVPENLVARIQEAIDDEATDQRLRDVPVPVHMISRLWSIAQRKPALVRMRQFALAASVFLMVGVSYLLAMLGIVGSAYNITLQPAPFVLRTDRVDLELDIVEPSLQDGDAFVQLPPMESPPELDGPPIDLVADASPRSDDAIDEVRSLLRKSSRSLEDIYRQMWMGLGSPLATDDMLPELETAPPVTSSGKWAPG